jgi:GAF domain-containing protein/HAMP domain-containing protein
VLLSYLNDRTTRQALTEAANEKLKAAAEQTRDSIDSFIQTNLSTIQTEARLPGLIDYLNLPSDQQRNSSQEIQALTILRTLSGKNQNISSYALLDRRGLDVLDTYAADIDLNKFTSDYFQKPLETHQPYASPLRFSATTGELVVYFSTPVETAGEIIGILAVRYNAEALQQLVIQKTDLVGKGSFAVLLDEDHIRLADGDQQQMAFKAVVPLTPDRLAALKADGRLPDLSPAELATNLAGFEQGLASVTDQQPYFAAELHAAGEGLKQSAAVKTSSQKWLVVFAQPQEVFLAPVAEQARNTLAVMLVIIVVVIAVAVGVAQLLSGPIVHLTSVARQVAAGDLAIQAHVRSRDETGVLAVAFNSMTTELRDVFSTLEQRIQARTAQLRASADVGRAVTSILDTDQLLSTLVNLITDQFGFYYAAVFIIEPTGKFAVLREATGEAGRILKERGHKLEVARQSMVGTAIASGRVRIALDVGREAVRFANPLLPDTRSEIALPLVVCYRVLGALDVQATQEAAFDESNAAVLQSMADQIAIALNNALSYTETQAVARRSRALFAAGREVGHLQSDLAGTVRATLHAAADELAYDRWCVLTFNEIRTALVSIAAHNWPDSEEALDVQTQADHPLVYCVQQDAEIFIDEPLDPRLRRLKMPDLRGLISVPIKTRDTDVGVLAFTRTIGSVLTEGDLEVGRSLANLVAVASENYNLLESGQRTLRKLDEVNRQLTGESWEKFTRRRSQRDFIWVSRSDQLQPQALLEVTEALALGHIATRLLDDGEQLGVAVPIKLRDMPIGTLRMIIPLRAWTTELAASLDSIAGHVAQAAENARLIAESEERLARERALTEATEKIRQHNEIDSILETAATELARYLNANRIAVRMATPGEQAAVDDRAGGNGHAA